MIGAALRRDGGPTPEISAPVRVRYADTDQMGVVYYANYLIWFEVGRNEYLRAVGYPYVRLEKENIRMPVAEVSCHYHAPARYDDLLDVRTRIDDLGAASVRFSYRVVRSADEQLLATGATRHAAVGPSGRPCRIPEEVKRCLRG